VGFLIRLARRPGFKLSPEFGGSPMCREGQVAKISKCVLSRR